MPNIKSAKKRVLVAKKKAAQNKAARSALKTVLKKANTGDPAAVKVPIFCTKTMLPIKNPL